MVAPPLDGRTPRHETIHLQLSSKASNLQPDVFLPEREFVGRGVSQVEADQLVECPVLPGVRSAVWLLWAALYLVIVTAMMLMGPGERVTLTPLYLLQQGAALITGIVAVRAAFASVIPGASVRVWSLPIASAVGWLALVLWEVGVDARTAGTIGLTSQTDWPCVASMMLGGVILGLPLVWMLHGGAPLTPRTTAFLAGVAALSVANVEACLLRPHAFAVTVLLWHGATIVAAAAGAAMIVRRSWRWPALMR